MAAAANVKSVDNLLSLLKRYLHRFKRLRNHRMLADPELWPAYHIQTSTLNAPIFRRILSPKREDEYCTRRTFIHLPGSSAGRRREFNGRKLVGFSMVQMYSVVSDVENYKNFVPFCKRSFVHVREKDYLRADLVIGFPPIIERYTSHVTLVEPNIVYAECKDATLFNHLHTNWKFTPGLSKNPQSCVVNFHVSFEFKSIFHSHLANIFFNELVKQMEKAFFSEACRRYGEPSIPSIRLKRLDSTKG